MTAESKPAVVVTGANGYIGRHLTAALLAAGYEVRALTRAPAKMAQQEGVLAFPYRLAEPPEGAPFESACAVVHAAFDVNGALSDDAEVDAAKSLLARARQSGATRFVFLSSIEARHRAASSYARRKWDIEQAVLASGGVVVRPGLVYGGEAGGLFATLDNVAKHAPLIPALLPAPRVQPIHVADLCRGITRLLANDHASGVYTLAQARSLTLTAFLRQVAWRRHRRLLPAVWVPAVGARLLVRAATLLRVLPRRYATRLAGLFAMRTKQADDAETRCHDLGVHPRPLGLGLGERNGKYRDLLEEARAVTRYLAGRHASGSTLAHYAKAVTQKQGGKALDLPRWCMAFPPAIRCIDPNRLGARRNPALAWRLDAAFALCEVDVRLARSFHLRSSRGWFAALCGLALHAALEILLMPCALLVGRPRGRSGRETGAPDG